MATKSVKKREDVYNRLLEVRGESESFSDTINRLIERRSSVLGFSGALKQNDTDLKFIEEETKKLRKSAKLRGLSL